MPTGSPNPQPNHSNQVDDYEDNCALILGCDAIALAAGLTDWNHRNETFYGPSVRLQAKQPEIAWQTYQEAVIGLRAAARLFLFNTGHLAPDWEKELSELNDRPEPLAKNQTADPGDNQDTN